MNHATQQQRLADDSNREAALADYFRDYADPEADQYELQRRAAELKPTDSEWAEYHSRRIAATEKF